MKEKTINWIFVVKTLLGYWLFIVKTLIGCGLMFILRPIRNVIRNADEITTEDIYKLCGKCAYFKEPKSCLHPSNMSGATPILTCIGQRRESKISTFLHGYCGYNGRLFAQKQSSKARKAGHLRAVK